MNMAKQVNKPKRKKTVLAPIVTVLEEHKEELRVQILNETTTRALMQKWQEKTPRIVIQSLLEGLATKEDCLWILQYWNQRIDKDDYKDPDLMRIARTMLPVLKEMYQDSIHDIVTKEVYTLDKYLSEKSHSKVSDVFEKELEKPEESEETDREDADPEDEQ